MHLQHLFPITIFLVFSVEGRQQNRPFNGNALRTPGIPIVPAPNRPVVSRNGTHLAPYNTTYLFDQLIDHTNPSLGTFKQRFWHTYEYYQPGGPVILSTPGETNAAGVSFLFLSFAVADLGMHIASNAENLGYLTNVTVNGLIAQSLNGSTVVLEHRFFGFSNPYPDLSVKSLSVLNIQQAIDDFEYFAKNVNLPMPDGDQLTPDKAPWILVGGSYAGALTSWTMVNKPGLFQAGYASSAVVEAIADFWQYFEPIRQNMAANCSADVQAVISHIDEVFSGTNATAIDTIKANFGLGALTHLDDVAGSLRNNLWDWQSLQVFSGNDATFYEFCDGLEVDDNGKKAPASGFGLDHALAAWGNYWRIKYLDYLCGDRSVPECLGTHDATTDYYTNTAINNYIRSWNWFVCNEVGWLQESAPIGQPSLVSRLVQPAYEYRQCQLMFPEAFPAPRPPTVEAVNRKYHGWNVHVDGLFFANGIRDPWRYATLSVGDGTMFHSTPTQPISVSNGFHCSDILSSQGRADPTVAKVQSDGIVFMKRRVEAFKPSKLGHNPPRPKSSIAGESGNRNSTGSGISDGKPINAWFRPTGVVDGA